MSTNKYWYNFWKTNDIVNKSNPQEKVGRTIQGVPISEGQWKVVIEDLKNQLNLNSSDIVLDIGAGSGVIAMPFSSIVKEVVAVDVSETLLNEMKGIEKIKTVLSDAREIYFEPNSFSKIIIYFAIQHFTEKETIELIQKSFKWLKKDGILFIGDIPDINRQFSFFNNRERQSAFFDSVLNDKPIVGTWFQKDFFNNISSYAGFNKVEILDQPSSYINAHYRFDAIFRKI